MKKSWKRKLAALLVAALVVSLVPMALAAEREETPPDLAVAEGVEWPLADQNEPEEIAPAPVSAELQTPLEVLETEEETEEEPQADLLSLLPLEIKRISVNLGKVNPLMLQRVKLSDILAEEIQDAQHPNRPLKGTEKVAWAGSDRAFKIAELSDTIDLSSSLRYTLSRRLEMIVGSAKQLDPDNVRYIVDISAELTDDWLVPTIYKQDKNGARVRVTLADYGTHRYGSKDELTASVKNSELKWSEEAYLGLAFAEGIALDDYKVVIEKTDKNGKTTDITNMLWQPDLTQKGSGYAIQEIYTIKDLKLKLYLGEKVVASYAFDIGIEHLFTGVSVCSGLLNDAKENASDYGSYHWDRDKAAEIYTYTLKPGCSADAEYYSRWEFYVDGESVSAADAEFSNFLKVKGYYKTRKEAEAAIAAGKTSELKETQLDYGYVGYKDNYSSIVYYSFFYGEEGDYFGIQVEEAPVIVDPSPSPSPAPTPTPKPTPKPTMAPDLPGSSSTTFNLIGLSAYSVDGDTHLQSYILPYAHDSYYGFSYQTALVLADNLDLTQLKPHFFTGAGVVMRAGTPLVDQVSGENILDFSNGPVNYTATSENHVGNKNYYVTVVGRCANGPSLFISGVGGPRGEKEADGSIHRELFLDSFYGGIHDIFLANVGSEPLTGLKVELSSDATHVKLDEYWTVGGEKNDTLAPFTQIRTDQTYIDRDYNELDNVAKIRLVPDGDGEIKGKLSITYGVGQETMVFNLTGRAGDPTIVTTEIPVGVKYVPYGTVIQNNNTYDWNKVTYSLVENRGELPKGMKLMPNGEIYGVPQETGEFTFRVRMDNSAEIFSTSYATFTLKIMNDTAENVAAQTDEGYEMSGLPDKMSSYTDQTFKSEGAMGEFIALWLDGQKLVEGEDYTKKEGSTVITADSKVFRDAGRGSHTLAFEFRVNGDVTKELKKAAQKYSVGSSSGGSTGLRPNPNAGGATTTTNKPTTKEFIDVPKSAWFYDEVQWAVKNNAMIGVSDTAFAPNTLISQAMVTTVMARMSKVDLARYSDVTGTNLLAGQWYTNASVWAWKGGIVGDSNFSALEPITRGDLAVMLVRYLDYRAVSHPKPTTPVEFADSKDMTTEESEAFQALYAAGILKGVGDNYMAPDRSTTRVELAVIAHRLSDYFAKR